MGRPCASNRVECDFLSARRRTRLDGGDPHAKYISTLEFLDKRHLSSSPSRWLLKPTPLAYWRSVGARFCINQKNRLIAKINAILIAPRNLEYLSSLFSSLFSSFSSSLFRNLSNIIQTATEVIPASFAFQANSCLQGATRWDCPRTRIARHGQFPLHSMRATGPKRHYFTSLSMSTGPISRPS